MVDRDLENASHGVDCVVVPGEYSSENRLAHSAKSLLGGIAASSSQAFSNRDDDLLPVMDRRGFDVSGPLHDGDVFRD
jgi:hypothetical protein